MNGPIIVDSSLLLLFVVGTADAKYIAMHKKLTKYSILEFELLSMILDEFTGIILVPHVLAEVSNHAKQISGPPRLAVYSAMKLIIERYDEQTVASRLGSRRSEFMKLHLTDAILLALSSTDINGRKPTLLTDDLDLAIAAEINDYNFVNFNHLRD